MRNTLVASAFTMLSIATASAQLTIPKEYLPEVHGTIRGKYELQTTNGLRTIYGNVIFPCVATQFETLPYLSHFLFYYTIFPKESQINLCKFCEKFY